MNVHGLRPGRATRDIDFGIAVESWAQFELLKERLLATNDFSASRAQQRLTFADSNEGISIPVDLIPFRGVASANGTIAWPPSRDIVMNVAGFEEALTSSVLIEVGTDLTVHVASVPTKRVSAILGATRHGERQGEPIVNYAAEYVFPGHPDKLCDSIADALVEEAARREKRALCGVEVAVHRASLFITGRIACAGAESIPVEEIARECYRSAGYVDDWFPSPEEVEVRTNLCLGPLTESESAFRDVSDDQSIVTGYAVDSPGTNWLPPEHWLVWRLSQCVQRLRAADPELALGPDGKVVLVYDSEKSALSAFSASVQQKIGGSEIDLHRAVRDAAAGELRDCASAIPGFRACLPEQFHVNGAGNFEVGGPEGDNGLSGKKLVVDAYGPRVPIGGGALSGKDFFKADRAGAILARRLARTVVAAGLAGECIATLATFPGDLAFRIVSVRDGKGAPLDPARRATLMDLSLGAAGERYALTHDLPIVARHGHFTSADYPWEGIRF